MALRDWLNPDYDPLATVNPASCLKSEPQLAGLATISKRLASSANLQHTDSIDEKSRISRISKISISKHCHMKTMG